MPAILLSQIIPSADDLLALEPEELGLALLQCFKSYSDHELETYYGHRNNFLNSGDPVKGYGPRRRAAVASQQLVALDGNETDEVNCGMLLGPQGR